MTVYTQLATNHYDHEDEDDDEHLAPVPLDPMDMLPYDEEVPPTSPVTIRVHDEISEASSCVSASNPRPPCNYVCPLTLQVMNEPMNDGCGHCFDRDAIVAWLEYHEMCPISRKPITRRELRPSRALRSRIQKWKRLHDYKEEQDNGDGVELMTYPRNETYSPMELILLPQERKVLGAIKIRAHALRRQRRKERIIWSIGGVVVGVIVIVLSFVLKSIGGDWQGPI
jgi:hypothetical protein